MSTRKETAPATLRNDTRPARVMDRSLLFPLTLTVAITFALPSIAAESRAATPTPDSVVATVGDQRVTRQQLEERIRGKLIELDTERYEALLEGLEEMIDEILIEQAAKARGLSAEALIKQEVTDKAAALDTAEPIGAEEVEQFYEEYKDSLGNRSLEELRPSIENYLRAQRLELTRVEFEEELRRKGSVTIHLKPPLVEVTASGPMRGPANAPVTIIAFSDFECPFCQRAAETIDKVVTAYPEAVKLVFRNYPLPSHPHARRAAEAAHCADEEGKFWGYHNALFKNQHALAEADLIGYAQEVGIDEATFRSCLQSGRGAATVTQDMTDGDAAGVNGTPAFFINGRPMSGALPYETFKQAVDEALAQRQPSDPATAQPDTDVHTGSPRSHGSDGLEREEKGESP